MSHRRFTHFLFALSLAIPTYSCRDSSQQQSASGETENIAATGITPVIESSESAISFFDKQPVADEYQNPLSPGQIANGWISLFDGHTLFGWESNDEEVNWRAEDRTITADAGPNGLIHTTVPFADYELKCDFRFEPDGNSGLFLRTIHRPKSVQTDCYELNLADSHPAGFTTGSYVSLEQAKEPIIASGAWHTFHVTLEGGRSTVKLDDKLVLDFTDDRKNRPAAGYIGLQHRTGKVAFRNILLKPLGMTDLFNGEDLSDWREVPGSKSVFQVVDGTIHVTNGSGFLETEGTYGDFIFQADAIVHGDELNSGYFFRAIPGSEDAPSNGYELQIHNGFTDDDRTKPNNAGTGAIFRRTEARRVVSSDNAWFTSTLVAYGPRIAVWIDGYQVTDWEDTREPHENPRKGRRLDPGHISLQGHDPTTDLSFRNLKIAELPQH